MDLIAELDGWPWVVAGAAVTILLVGAVAGWSWNEWRSHVGSGSRTPDVAHAPPESQADERTDIDESASGPA